MYVVIAIILFGVLIAVHELGHFTAAKAFGVKVNEFAIGMGPALFKKQGKETLYSLRLLPIGGFCAMEGEDEDTGDERAFTAQKRWKRVIILAAGAFANFLVGFIIVVILYSSAQAFAGTTVTKLAEGFPSQGTAGLMEGDTIVSIDGERVYFTGDFSMFMGRSNGESVDLVIKRNGEKIKLDDYPLQLREYVENGETVKKYGINFNMIEGTVGAKLKYSVYSTMNFVRLIRISLGDLVRGAVGIKDLSGPVGIVNVMNEVGHESANVGAAVSNIMYLCAFIAVNLGVMNLLPIPALDGGRIFLMLVTAIIEKISRRKINPKYEGYIHSAGFILLLGLMAFVLVNDVVKIVSG